MQSSDLNSCSAMSCSKKVLKNNRVLEASLKKKKKNKVHCVCPTMSLPAELKTTQSTERLIHPKHLKISLLCVFGMTTMVSSSVMRLKCVIFPVPHVTAVDFLQ